MMLYTPQDRIVTLGAGMQVHAPVVGGAAATPLLDNLIAYWSLDEASGNALDAHSTNHLTDNNTVGSAAGKVGTARQFVRTSLEKLSLADNAAMSVGDIARTWAGWVYLTDKSAGSNGYGLVTKDDFTLREFHIAHLGSTDRFRFTVFGSSGGGNRTDCPANSFGAPSIATWYFLVCKHNPTSNIISIQVNNGVVDSVAHSTGVYDGAAPFTLGAFGTNSDWYLNGRLDEWGIWNEDLSATYLTWLYNSGNGRSYAEIASYSG